MRWDETKPRTIADVYTKSYTFTKFKLGTIGSSSHWLNLSANYSEYHPSGPEDLQCRTMTLLVDIATE